MSKALISIVLTLYNKAPYIEETLFSIYKQTYTNRELIIVDDCSTDGSLEIAKSFCEKVGITEKCKLIQNEKNLRVAKTFERGLQEAKGDWISVQDGDDILMKNKLEENLNFCKEHDFDFCHSDLVMIDENNNILHPSRMKRVHFSNETKGDPIYANATGSSLFFSKQIAKDLIKTGFPKTVYQDWRAYVCSNLKHYKIGLIPKALVYYRRTISSITWYESQKKTNTQCIHDRIEIFHKEIDCCSYIIDHSVSYDQDVLMRCKKHIALNQQFITFLESNKILLPFSLLKEIPFVREKKFYYRIGVLQFRKLLYRVSNLFQRKSDS